ncbi:hypothetical protein NPIL_636041 [Nephila pilipes]|uniref:Uncharacterized protein n=1 Tax=Nephila pilipes TaxID=299642 RepID=A0A8X6PAI7_NEPPI|nr:hypothetical protein NPIL_636041 [Nephila pilipes]
MPSRGHDAVQQANLAVRGRHYGGRSDPHVFDHRVAHTTLQVGRHGRHSNRSIRVHLIHSRLSFDEVSAFQTASDPGLMVFDEEVRWRGLGRSHCRLLRTDLNPFPVSASYRCNRRKHLDLNI